MPWIGRSNVRPSLPFAFLIPLLGLGALIAGCQREESPDLSVEINRLKTEVTDTERKLTAEQKNLEVASAELALASAAVNTAKSQLVEKDQIAAKKDTQIRALQTEVDTLKKRDAFAFAEITALRQQGQSIVALSQYQKFLTDFPQSVLVGPATSAIAELSAERARDTRRWAEMVDPKRQEHQVLKHFGDGLTTLAELAPVLKKRSLAQVRTMLGRPDQTFNEGTELGYVDKAINPTTGRPGLLIIGFESGTVSTLRVEYAGRKITP